MTKLPASFETATIDLTAIEERLSGLSPEKLKFRFFECFNGAAQFIAEAAICVKLLKRHGQEYLAGIPYAGIYLRVAEGQIDPLALWQFIESPNRTRVGRLPLSDQKRLAADPMVPVVVPLPNGKIDKQRVDLRTAKPEVARLVLGNDGIRSPEEQLAFLGQEKAARTARPKPAAEEEAPIKEPLDHKITVSLTASEFQALTINAVRRNKKPAVLARWGLLKSGVLEEA